MTAPDFRPYKRSAEVVGHIINGQEGLGLGFDEVEIASLQTAVFAMDLVPELYEALDALIPLAEASHFGGPDTAALLATAYAAITKVRLGA